jgi:lipid-binding SYLF domain-containing protein
MKATVRAVALVFIAGMSLLACAHAPTQPGERADLVRDARQTLARMETKDPSLRPLIDRSVGYVVFPAVGSGGFIVGGGGGAGVLFEHGVQTGFATIEKLQAGALAGGQRYAQVVVIRDQRALDDLKTGRFDFGAQAQAVIVRTGASADATFENGVAVFVDPIHGAMVNASVGGQKIRLTM